MWSCVKSANLFGRLFDRIITELTLLGVLRFDRHGSICVLPLQYALV